MFGKLIVPTNPTEFWALITAIGTFLIAALAWRGLRSLGLARIDMVTRATREGRACAIARCEEFAAKIIPANHEILVMFAKEQTPVFVRDPAEVRFDPDNETDLKRASDWVDNLSYPLQVKSLYQLNRLEAWAMYFTAQLADSAIAFGPCAPMYCSMIVQHYALLLHKRTLSSSGKYPSAVKLYKTWIAKLEDEQRGLKAGTLLKQLAQLQAQRASGDLPGPLGTEIDV
jgi:hypothetical protein